LETEEKEEGTIQQSTADEDEEEEREKEYHKGISSVSSSLVSLGYRQSVHMIMI